MSGEAVFSTAIVGYNESLTDPSYRGQILVFTQPLIGNYGVPSREARDEFNLLKHFESEYIQPVGVVVVDVARKYSHWTAIQSLGDWCTQQGVAAITGVDTRAIVTFLRERGSTLGKSPLGRLTTPIKMKPFKTLIMSTSSNKSAQRLPFMLLLPVICILL